MNAPTTVPKLEPLAVSAKVLAHLLSVSVRTIRGMDAAGKLPKPVRLSRAVRWRRSDIDKCVRLGCVSRDEFEAACAAGVRP